MVRRTCPDAENRRSLPSSSASPRITCPSASMATMSYCTWWRNSVSSNLLWKFMIHSMSHPARGSSGPYFRSIRYSKLRVVLRTLAKS